MGNKKSVNKKFSKCTYGNGTNIYSVDMMFAFVNSNPHQVTRIKVNTLTSKLVHDCWGNPVKKIKFSPMDVIDNPEKYPTDMLQINNATLSFPIIMTEEGHIVDGMHRITKCYLQDIKYIDAYIFNDALMEKFIIGDDWVKIDTLKKSDFVKLYFRNFYPKIELVISDKMINNEIPDLSLYQCIEYFIGMIIRFNC